jgi:glutathione S-transferase
MARLRAAHPGLLALHRRVMERPRIAAYLVSDRRLPYNQHGLFRHYPELDAG